MWNQEDFITRVQKMAIDRNTNLKAITKEIGISNSSFTDWKKGRGKPSIETFCKLAEYFDVTLDELAYGTKPVQLDLSNRKLPSPFETKFGSLSPAMQSKVLSYMDGMMAAMEDSGQDVRLSV